MPRFLKGFPSFARAAARPILPVSRLASPTRLTVAPAKSFSFFRPFTSSRVRLLPTPSTSPASSRQPSPGPPPEPKTLSDRLKQLIKSYGWYALGVYIVLSALDFSVAFAAVNILGAEYVSSAAASVKSFVLHLLGRDAPAVPGEPEVPHTGSEGLYAMLVVAYTIHKTLFLPVRIGLTAAVTPRFVGWLGRRGWTGVDGARRASREIRDRSREVRDRIRRDSNSSGRED
ncbi:hypothetical protein M422DRAFT_27849 [Sphaerobolus stellatus SS14]|nr:hypothetical protein M422DRAFT_27849 [Sphaerobolus stellatus SS14]